MPPGVHPLAAPRIPTPPFRLPQTPSFNRYTNKLARYALKGVARRLSGPLGIMQDAYDIAQWYDGYSGTKEQPKSIDFGGSCASFSGNCPPVISLGTGMQRMVSASCVIPNYIKCLSGQPVHADSAKVDDTWLTDRRFNMFIIGPITWKGGATEPYWRMTNQNIVIYPQNGSARPRVIPGIPRTMPDTHNALSTPAIDPLSLPIQKPMPAPKPIPVSFLPGIKPNPNRVPSERRDYGLEPKPNPWPEPTPLNPYWPFPVLPFYPVNPEPWLPPTEPSVPSIDFDTGFTNGKKLITPRPGRHYKRPPGRNERETKKTLNPSLFARLARMGISGATEGADFVGAVYEALPTNITRFKGRDGKWRDKDMGPINKAIRIFNNLDKLDVDQAVKNLIYNHLEDKLIGKLSAGARKDLERKGWTSNRNPFGTPSTLPDIGI